MKALRKMICFFLLLAIIVSLCGCEVRDENSDGSNGSDENAASNAEITTIASTDEVSELWNEYVVEQNVEKINFTYTTISVYLSSEFEKKYLIDDNDSIKTALDVLKELGDAPCERLDSYPADLTWINGGYLFLEFINKDEAVFAIRFDLLNHIATESTIISINENQLFEMNLDPPYNNILFDFLKTYVSFYEP